MGAVVRFISCAVFHFISLVQVNYYSNRTRVEFNSSRKIKCTRRAVEKVGEYRTSLPALKKAGVRFHPFWMLERTLGESKSLSERKGEWQRDKGGWEYNSDAVPGEMEGLDEAAFDIV